MAGVMPTTSQEAMMKVLQQLAVAKAAPDANLEELAALEESVIASIRKPYDTASPGSPAAGSAMAMSNGASAPPADSPAPGQLSPMLAALMGGGESPMPAGPHVMPGGQPMGGAAAGSFPTHGLMATSTPPNMDEVRRMLQP